MNSVKTVLSLCILMLLTACTKPLPEERRHYEGYWQGTEISLFISAQGQVEYQRQSGNSKKSVSGPLQRFEEDDFIVGLAFISTQFHVMEAPHQVNGEWQMVVDGDRLTRRPHPSAED